MTGPEGESLPLKEAAHFNKHSMTKKTQVVLQWHDGHCSIPFAKHARIDLDHQQDTELAEAEARKTPAIPAANGAGKACLRMTKIAG